MLTISVVDLKTNNLPDARPEDSAPHPKIQSRSSHVSKIGLHGPPDFDSIPNVGLHGHLIALYFNASKVEG